MRSHLKGAWIPGWTLSPSGNGLHVGVAHLPVLLFFNIPSSAVPLKRPFNSLSFSEEYKKYLCMLSVALYILTITCGCNFCIPTEEVLNPSFFWFRLNWFSPYAAPLTNVWVGRRNLKLRSWELFLWCSYFNNHSFLCTVDWLLFGVFLRREGPEGM